MKLAVIDNDGVIHEVDDAIEEYNLDKPMARSTICEKIQDVVEELRPPVEIE